jgi:uncharacterized protein
MTREVARRALRLLKPPGPWRVSFFGGEPLLAWDLVREATAFARARAAELGAEVSFSITTNGTLLDRGRAGFLKREGFSLIVSLDGPRGIHDRERRVRGRDGSRGSFDDVLAGLSAAREAGLGARTTLRATFPLARPALRERLEFLNDLADRGFARAVSVEPAWPGRDGPAPLDALPGEYLDAARWAVARLRSGGRLRFHHLEKALERVLLKAPAGSECGAGFGYLEVAPDGSIHACHKEAGGALGHVDTGVVERLRAPWRESRWYGREACPRCWARNVCGGGCRAESAEHEGALARPWPVACAAKRLQVRAALLVAALAPRDALGRMFSGRLRSAREVGRAVRSAS